MLNLGGESVLSGKPRAIAWLVIGVLAGAAGCGSAPMVPLPQESAAVLAPSPQAAGTPDQVRLKDAFTTPLYGLVARCSYGVGAVTTTVL